MEVSWRGMAPPVLSWDSPRWMAGPRSKMLCCEPAPVNSNSQVTTNELDAPWRLTERTRAHWVLPGLVAVETGSGEINGTKYMNDSTGFPADESRLKSRLMVGPVGVFVDAVFAGGAGWLKAGNAPMAESKRARTIE